ncbi:MAG: hypothetical protein ACLQDY_25630 [Streptosporangiaceae bacterium]
MIRLLDEARVTGLIEHHAGESHAVLPRLLGEGRQFDLAIVDGNHRFDAVFVDLYYLGCACCVPARSNSWTIISFPVSPGRAQIPLSG